MILNLHHMSYYVQQDSVGVDNPLDYDQQLKKYGWRMEIPGDPYHLK